MLAILDAYTDVLPPTKTYSRRSFCWIPADPESPEADGRIGNLTIKLQHSKSGVRRNVECDTYAVERDTPEPGDNGGTAFWLMNMTDPDAEEPYRCVVGGMNPKCGCTAGKCKVPPDEGATLGCKHRDAIEHLIEGGYI